MELKDFIKILFQDKEAFENLNRNEKAKFFFMTNRIMSIAFPIQAQMFNHTRISQPHAVDYWQGQMSKLYKKTPSWVYTSSASKRKKTEKAKWPSDEAISFYLERTNMSRRDLKEAVDIFGSEALAPIFKIEKIMLEN